MNALYATAAILIMVACFTVLPFWLVIYQGVPVPWGLGGGGPRLMSATTGVGGREARMRTLIIAGLLLSVAPARAADIGPWAEFNDHNAKIVTYCQLRIEPDKPLLKGLKVTDAETGGVLLDAPAGTSFPVQLCLNAPLNHGMHIDGLD